MLVYAIDIPFHFNCRCVVKDAATTCQTQITEDELQEKLIRARKAFEGLGGEPPVPRCPKPKEADCRDGSGAYHEACQEDAFDPWDNRSITSQVYDDIPF